jgi:hypothetical protein
MSTPQFDQRFNAKKQEIMKKFDFQAYSEQTKALAREYADLTAKKRMRDEYPAILAKAKAAANEARAVGEAEEDQFKRWGADFKRAVAEIAGHEVDRAKR